MPSPALIPCSAPQIVHTGRAVAAELVLILVRREYSVKLWI